MTTFSVPFKMGKGTRIRFDKADITAIEDALGCGHPYFTNPGVFGSLTATEAFIWRGLRMEAPDGKLLHVFSLNDAGKDEAGNAVLEYLRDAPEPSMMDDAIIEGFIACGIRRRKKSDEPVPAESGQDAPKNLTT